jgi:hypothetical protein
MKFYQATITLPDNKVMILTGDLEVSVTDGLLTVWDYNEPRGGSDVAFAAVPGQWLTVSLNKTNDMAS